MSDEKKRKENSRFHNPEWLRRSSGRDRQVYDQSIEDIDRQLLRRDGGRVFRKDVEE